MTENRHHLPKEFRVHAAGWERNPESERYPVPPLGHVMPKVYVLIAEVFALKTDADTDAIVNSMRGGLETSLSRFPVLTGNLEMDATSGSMWVNKSRGSTVGLHVKFMPGEDEFASYEKLAEKDFPANLIAGSKLLPDSVTAKQLHSPLGDNNEEGIPVAVFQINFIRGGLVLGAAFHHVLTDGPGCDGFLTTWAEYSAAIAKGTPPSVPSTPLNTFGFERDVEKPSPGRIAELEAAFPVFRDAGGPMAPPPPGFKMPSLVPQMWHFPRSKAEELKLQASKPGEVEWISTYDAIMALLWSSVTRAKLGLLDPELNSKAILVHAFDTRKTWDPPLPERCLTVGSAPLRCEPLAVKDIIAPENLSTLAASMRTSIKAMTPQRLVDMVQWVTSHPDQRWLEISMSSFLGLDFGASSWQGMSSYEKHDFGFGLPKALRWPSPAFEGFAFVYPSRASTGIKEEAMDEGVEVCVCLEESCQERLMRDEILLAYAQPRGL
ncbi:transferase family-domain-containing protein [Dactylonectria macrodidyma]|uniref:Transferase family-domain-containing protein n=1 Tax=Dactylonectria macrodidyma TaxID=307937 RepID=A0A9P9I767_9HYPO|nr:transferase family-domain-containing protein [Dactylonectria macrodidyma]